MNILTDDLPCTAAAGGREYFVNTDFRVWIKFEALVTGGGEISADTFLQIVTTCFDLSREKCLPPTAGETLEALFEFYSCGRKSAQGGGVQTENKKRIYSFEHDAAYIYAAFYSQYGIDLSSARLHWFVFSALFAGLEDKRRICEIMSIRAINLADITDKRQKRYYRIMKSLYRLPDMRSEEEKERCAVDALSSLV